MSSGAIALGRHTLKLPKGALELEQSQAAAAVGQISLAHAYQDMCARARARRGADPADARRYRGAPPLSQRAPHHRDAARPQGRAGRQRERHGGDHRDPLRRQRPPVGARRHHDDAPTAWCCCPTSTASTRRRPTPARDAHASRGRHRHHARDRGHGRRRRHRAVEGRHGHQDRGGEDRARRPAPTWSSPAARCCIPLRAIGEGAPCTWFLAHSDPVTARKRWIAGQLEPKGHVHVDAGAEKALAAGKSLLPAGVSASRAPSSAATP